LVPKRHRGVRLIRGQRRGVKTDKIDTGTLASLQAAGYLPQIWTPDAGTERKRRSAARRYQIVRHRTRLKNEVHSILHALQSAGQKTTTGTPFSQTKH